MKTYIALLRAVNVGGTGKLPMVELRAMCEALGFGRVRTYIASGNVVFRSNASPARVKNMLQVALHGYAGKSVDVQIHTHTEMAAILAANPFPDAVPNRDDCLAMMGIVMLNPSCALDARRCRAQARRP